MLLSSSYLWVLAFTLLGSVLSVLAAAAYLLVPEHKRRHSVDYLLSFAIGMLLGAGFLHLLPDAIEQARDSAHGLMGTALAAILVFFILEKGLIWRHHHHHDDGHAADDGAASHDHSTAAVILVGDSVHNFLDGILIAAAFAADPGLGVVTALAVIAHEIPQELGDFAILLHAGFSAGKALAANLVSSLAMIVGATLAWFTLAELDQLIPYLLTFTAASFLYVAVSDLMPALNRRIGARAGILQVLLIGGGIGVNLSMHAYR